MELSTETINCRSITTKKSKDKTYWKFKNLIMSKTQCVQRTLGS